MAKIPNIDSPQSVPSGPLSWLRDWLNTMRLWVLTRDPTALSIGDPVDKFTTRDDLIGWGLITRTAANEFSVGVGGIAGPTGPPGPTGSPGAGVATPDLTPPPTPSGLAVAAGITHLFISWTAPAYTVGHGHFQTKIYGAIWATGDAEPTFVDVRTKLIDAVTGAGEFDAYASNPSTRWCIWITFVTNDGIESVTPAGGAHGVQATTGQDVSSLLTALAGAITTTQLYSTLNTRINLIDAADSVAGSVAARVKTETDARITAVSDAISSANTYTATYAYPKATGEQVAIDLLALNSVVVSPTTGLAATRATLVNDYATIAGATNSLASTSTSLKAYANAAATGRGAMNADPGCQRVDAWELTAPGVSFSTTSTPTAVGVGIFIFDAAVGLNCRVTCAENIPINPARRYRLTARLLVAAGSDRDMYLTVRMFRATGVELTGADTGWGGSYAGYAYGGVPSSSAFTEYGTDFGAGTSLAIPSDVAYMRVMMWGQYSAGSSSGLQYAQDIRLVDVTDARLAKSEAIAYTNTYAYAQTEGEAVAGRTDTLTARLNNFNGAAGVNIETNATATASSVSGLMGVYTVKIDNNGFMSGYGLSSSLVAGGTPTSTFLVSVDKFAVVTPPSSVPDWAGSTYYPVNTIRGVAGNTDKVLVCKSAGTSGTGAPAIAGAIGTTLMDGSVTWQIGSRVPFAVLTVPTTINGVSYPAGTYFDAAYVLNATIQNAQIANLAVDDAKIADLAVAKLLAGNLRVGGYIRSTAYSAGVSGWTINADGGAEFNNIVARGTIYAGAGLIGGNTIDSTGVQSSGYTDGNTGWRLDTSGLVKAFASAGARVLDMAATGASPVLKIGSALELLANGAATYAGALSAATGTLGALTISGGGNIKLGQTSFNTGTGFWIGDSGGTPKFSIGNPAGEYMAWDGSHLSLTDPTFGTFSASITGGDYSVSVDSYDQAYGGRSVSVSGGKAPFSYIWSITLGSRAYAGGNEISEVWPIYGTTSASITLGGKGNGVTNHARAVCHVRDANGRVTVASFLLSAVHAVDSGGGGGGGGDP